MTIGTTRRTAAVGRRGVREEGEATGCLLCLVVAQAEQISSKRRSGQRPIAAGGFRLDQV